MKEMNYKADIRYMTVENNEFVFKDGIRFFSEEAEHQARNNFKVIKQECKEVKHSDHLFDLYIDGDLIDTYGVSKEDAQKIIDKYFVNTL